MLLVSVLGLGRSWDRGARPFQLPRLELSDPFSDPPGEARLSLGRGSGCVTTELTDTRAFSIVWRFITLIHDMIGFLGLMGKWEIQV